MRGYNTLSVNDKKTMLSEIGVDQLEDLFKDIPDTLKLKKSLNLPSAHSEWELEKKISKLANLNEHTDSFLSFLGGGKYNHFVPAVIDAIVNRGEYLTSYTPYQPEMSQGLLQALYEYQLVMAKLTGLEVVNSSCYDGATAFADAAWVSCSIKKKKCILVASSIWEEYNDVLKTYLCNREVKMIPVGFDEKSGMIDQDDLKNKIKLHDPAGFLFQSPNALGVLEDLETLAHICQQSEVISCLSFNPLTMGITETPGSLGIDIVTGEGQPFGMHLNAGGSSLGIFSTSRKYRKYVPGRLIGKVTDIKGNLAYSLVFEDREQHVAREKATSNICSNQALNAIRAGIFLSYVGERGLRNLALINAGKAEYLLGKLTEIDGVNRAFQGEYFNEFVIKIPKEVKEVIKKLLDKKIFAGINYHEKFGLKEALLISVTEKISQEEMDTFVLALKDAIS